MWWSPAPAGGDPLKGYIAGFLGLFIASIGQEPYYNYQRYAFGFTDLAGGIGLLPALVGAYGVAEVLQAMRGPAVKAISRTIEFGHPAHRRRAEVLAHHFPFRRHRRVDRHFAGLGEDAAAWSSYAAARRASKEKEKFGRGSIEGLMAAETGEASSVPGAIIPVLTLALPGSAPSAVLMAAMMIHGLNPGPNLMIESPQFFYQIIAMLVIADMSKLIFGFVLVRPLIKILLVPRERLMPIVFVLCVVGAYAITSRVFDIYVMLVFGLIGFVMRELKFNMAPLILGLVLGDLLEKNLTRGLVLSSGSLLPFFTRPVCAVLSAMTISRSSGPFRRSTPRANFLRRTLASGALSPAPSPGARAGNRWPAPHRRGHRVRKGMARRRPTPIAAGAQARRQMAAKPSPPSPGPRRLGSLK